MRYQQKQYRTLNSRANLKSFQVRVKETDLLVRADDDLTDITREALLLYRGYIEAHIRQQPEFLTALKPVPVNSPAPAIIQEMSMAAQSAGVGPMAAVAGAVAGAVGSALLQHTKEVMVENGGDIYIKSMSSVTVGVFAGDSPLSMKLGLQFEPTDNAYAVCTSSGTVGHSLSFGKADAVCVVSRSCALADACATAIGNRVRTTQDIQGAIEFGKSINGISGIIIIKDEKIGAWGDIRLVPLKIGKNVNSRR